MEAKIETTDFGWEVLIHHKGNADKFCVALESRARGGSKLLAIEEALQNLQSVVDQLEKIRSEEREQ